MHLTPSLASFHFSADPNSSLVHDLLNLSSSNDDDIPSNDYSQGQFGSNGGNGAGEDEDFGGFDQPEYGGGYDDDDHGGNAGAPFDNGASGGEVDFFADQFSSSVVPNGANGAAGAGGIGFGAVESFDPRRAGTGERDLVMSMDGNGRNATAGEEDAEGLFDYFDGKMKKNWAGPEHWKMRRNVKKGEFKHSCLRSASPYIELIQEYYVLTADENLEPGTPAAKKPRKAKEPFTLDFTADPPLSKEELFQPAAPKSSILLPGSTATARSRKSAQTKEEKEDYTLPDDYQFNSNVLLRLFLKPKTTVRNLFSCA